MQLFFLLCKKCTLLIQIFYFDIMSFDSPQVFPIKRKFLSAENVWTFVFEGTVHAKPGQFVNIWIPGKNEKPFSVARDYDGEIWLTICAVGPFSKAFCAMEAGEKIGLRGPYGKGFSIPEKKNIVLVGGGYGMAPLHNTGVAHMKTGSHVTAITGARSKENVLFVKECELSGFDTYITTDDGTAGHKGYTTQVLETILEKGETDLVQTCGPEKMMKVIAQMCKAKGVECEVSVERYMKCGFGVCGQCTVDGTGERMCQEGPITDGEYALEKFTDFGEYHRGAEGQKIYW